MINFKNKKSSPAAKQKDFKLQTNICYCKTVESTQVTFCRKKKSQNEELWFTNFCRYTIITTWTNKRPPHMKTGEPVKAS